jgi:glycogen synthase
MAAGVPVVATRVGGTPEAIDDGVTGLLVPPGEPDTLAVSIGLVLSDADLAARLGAAGREAVRNRFGMDRMVRATERLYRDLLLAREAERGRHSRLVAAAVSKARRIAFYLLPFVFLVWVQTSTSV